MCVDKTPFEFTSDAVSLEDVRLNLNFNEIKPDEQTCYVFSAPPVTDTLASPQSDTWTHDTSDTRKYEMPLSASEESLVNFANSLAIEETPSVDYGLEDPLPLETAPLLTNQISPSRNQMLASTPISPAAINRQQKVTFDSKPAFIVANKKIIVSFITEWHKWRISALCKFLYEAVDS